MEIRFTSKKLFQAAHSRDEATRLLGTLGERYIKRLDMILAAPDVGALKAIQALRLHPLKGQRRGQWGIDLNRNYRLVVAIEGDTVIIESVEDYHGD